MGVPKQNPVNFARVVKFRKAKIFTEPTKFRRITVAFVRPAKFRSHFRRHCSNKSNNVAFFVFEKKLIYIYIYIIYLKNKFFVFEKKMFFLS